MEHTLDRMIKVYILKKFIGMNSIIENDHASSDTHLLVLQYTGKSRVRHERSLKWRQ